MHGEDVARKDFSLSFRGFDQSEVRAYLAQVAQELASVRERDEELRARIAELESAPPPELDEVALETALGREATRVLHAAREAAAEIKANAEEQAAAMLAEAESVLAKSSMEAEESTAAIRAEVTEALTALREDAERRATAILEESRAKAAAMVVDATAERDAMRSDLESLRAARARLVASFDAVRQALDGALGEVGHADTEAARALATPDRDPALLVFDPAPMPEPEPEPIAVEPDPESDPEPEPDPEAEPVEGEPSYRHSASVRVLRPGGTPVAPEPDDPVEGVRLLEPVPVPEPEPEAEPVAVAPEPAVEDLFARLRATRAEKVASAEAVLAAPPGPTVEHAPPVEEERDALEADLTFLAARDEAIGDTERALVRALKRALADEQNEVLDALRRLKGRPTIDGLLPDVAAHDARYDGVLHGAATSAAAAGGHASSGGKVATELGRTITADLRARVGRAVEEAGGDVETLAEALSAAYREWKSSRVEPLALEVVTAGYAAGTYAAASGDLRWLVDPAEGGCPDCDDNALAGPTPKGTAFPTGQLHPPAHAGCRCLAVPAS